MDEPPTTYGTYVEPCVDCANLTAALTVGPQHTAMGSAWQSLAMDLTTGDGIGTSGTDIAVGFRCARTP